ncbi:MAG: YbdK family carboxylate-amine ligase [Solirubrobacteraceae bacterium]
MSLVPTEQVTSTASRSPLFTLGVEEELFVVDSGSLLPVAYDDALLAGTRSGRGVITEELCDGVVELATPVCDDAVCAVATLGGLRREVLCRQSDSLLGVGVHPSVGFGDVRHRASPHYDRVSHDTRSLLRQAAYCGVHVHVGMPDPETTIAAFNGMRKWVPVLQALSANSPFWHGQDSGLASARTVLCHSVPRTGLPGAFRDWEDYAQTLADLCRAAEVPDGQSVWWDIRPHPTLGTLEIRAVDAQSSLADLTGLSALVHGLACHEALTQDPHHARREVLQEASFRGLRDGIDATISLGGPLRSVRDYARLAIDLARGYLDRPGGADGLEHVERILAEGNGALRQRRAFAAGGMPAVLAQLRAETEAIA